MKRYQECNSLVKLIRLRHYLYIPFKWLWYKYINSFKVIDDGTFKIDNLNGIDLTKLLSALCRKYVFRRTNIKIPKCILWSVLIGVAQGKMNWYYTQSEVHNLIKKKYTTLNDEK